MQYGVIMAGGAGTRLWPLSRGNMPKQLLHGRARQEPASAQLRAAARHAAGRADFRLHQRRRIGDAVLANLPELPKENLLGEPKAATPPTPSAFPPPFCRSATRTRSSPSSPPITSSSRSTRFQTAIKTGFDVADENPNALVTFGIVPTHGHTGLGYIHRGEALPRASTARTRCRRSRKSRTSRPPTATSNPAATTGTAACSSGVPTRCCNELATHLPDAHNGLMQIADAWGTPQQDAVLNEVYPKLPKISIDYAVMEPAIQGKGKAQVVVVEMPVQWLDVGSWPALAETLDDRRARQRRRPPVLRLPRLATTTSSSAHDPDHLVTTIGVSDMIIVHTKDATLVCPKSEAQRVKELVGKVKEKFGTDSSMNANARRSISAPAASAWPSAMRAGSSPRRSMSLQVTSPAAGHRTDRSRLEHEGVQRIVVGLPLNMDGTLGPGRDKAIGVGRSAWKRGSPSCSSMSGSAPSTPSNSSSTASAAARSSPENRKSKNSTPSPPRRSYRRFWTASSFPRASKTCRR